MLNKGNVKKIKKFVGLLLAICLCMTSSIAYASEETADAVVVKDTEEERVAESWEEGVLYRSVYQKKEGILTIYTIAEDSVIDTLIITDDQIAHDDYIASYAVYPVQSPSGFGYVLDKPYNSYRCPEDFRQAQGLSVLGFNIGENTLADYQKEMRTAVENLCTYEAQVQGLTTASVFLDIMSLVLACFGQPAAAFTSAYTAYGFAVQARNAATSVHTNYNIAGSRFCRLEQSKV